MKKKFWIVNKVNATVAEILLYGFIGEYEAIDDASFIADLRELENIYSTINIRVNSGGGDVYKGLTIFNAIKNSKATINGFVDGIAASMGAVIIAACKNVQMSKYARYMTHRVTGFTGGNADDMRAFANELEQLETTIATIIAKRTGLTMDEAKEKYITNKDRWINAEQALTEKIIDGIYDAEPVEVEPTETNPQQLFNAYHKTFNITQQNQTEMKFIAQLLGLPENATEAQIIEAINKLKTAKETAENAVTATIKARAKALVDTAIANKQIIEADRADYEAQAETNYDFTAKVIAKIPVAKKPNELLNRTNITNDGGGVEDIDSWETLIAKGEAFAAKFKLENETEYSRLLNEYVNKPVATHK
jgi:ATP-dependent Clp endopeptidase proteolytic subunit ClpP